jgi:hypothetical protein
MRARKELRYIKKTGAISKSGIWGKYKGGSKSPKALSQLKHTLSVQWKYIGP